MSHAYTTLKQDSSHTISKALLKAKKTIYRISRAGHRTKVIPIR